MDLPPDSPAVGGTRIAFRDTFPWDNQSRDSLEGGLGVIARQADGDVAVAAIHLESGRRVAWNGNLPLPMASVYKVPIALTVLRRVDLGELSLADSITVHPRDFVGGANPLIASAAGRPVTATIGRLLGLMLSESDNTASDALMRAVGGPAAVEGEMHELGIREIDVSRYEAELFAEFVARTRPGDATAVSRPSEREDAGSDLRDTATADALADLLATIHQGVGLSAESRQFLLDHLMASPIAPDRIKGLLPSGTPVAHKTGTMGEVVNDIGIVTLPDGTHLAIAILTRGPATRRADQARAIARIARVVYDAFASPAP